MSFKNLELQKCLLKHFEKDGEQVYHKSQFLIFLFGVEHLLNTRQYLVPDEPELDNFNKLWKARLSFWLDQHLANSVVNLSDSSLGNYKEYIEHVNALENVDLQQKKETLCFLYSEQHYCQIHFYKYEDAEQSINKAKEIALLPLELTGRMGKRTKY